MIACSVGVLLAAGVVCQLVLNFRGKERERANEGKERKAAANPLQEESEREPEWWEDEEGEEYTMEVGPSDFLGIVLTRKVQSGRKEVKNVQEGSLAEMSGKVEAGDVLLRINSVEVGDLPEGGTQKLLVLTRRPFTLYFTRKYRIDNGKVEFASSGPHTGRARATPGEEEQGAEQTDEEKPDGYTVNIGANTALGVTLACKLSGHKVVSAIQPGGLAEKYGAIEPGDVLLKVGDADVTELAEGETQKLLREALRPLQLEFKRPEERNDEIGELNLSLDVAPKASAKLLTKALEEQERLMEAKPAVMSERERDAEKWRKRIQKVEGVAAAVRGVATGRSGFLGQQTASNG